MTILLTIYCAMQKTWTVQPQKTATATAGCELLEGLSANSEKRTLRLKSGQSASRLSSSIYRILRLRGIFRR